MRTYTQHGLPLDYAVPLSDPQPLPGYTCYSARVFAEPEAIPNRLPILLRAQIDWPNGTQSRTWPFLDVTEN